MMMATPVTMEMSVGIPVIVIKVAMGITIISVAIIVIAIAVPAHCDTARQRQADEKCHAKKKKLLIHIITSFLSSLSIETGSRPALFKTLNRFARDPINGA
jgi:hypothetical protein